MVESRVFAITGASRGIGRGIAEHLLTQGHSVAGCSRGASELACPGYRHTSVDVGDDAGIRDWLRGVRSEFGHLDGLITCAAIAPRPAPLMLTGVDTIESVLRVNVVGTYNACREAAKLMLPQRYGRIVTMSSIAANMHSAGASAYAASKSAVVEMSRVLAHELGDSGVTCNVVAPSVVQTAMLDCIGSEAVESTLAALTLKRPLTMAEICHVIEFLVSPASSAVTGQVIQMGLAG